MSNFTLTYILDDFLYNSPRQREGLEHQSVPKAPCFDQYIL